MIHPNLAQPGAEDWDDFEHNDDSDFEL
jgi:hypothetical protein